MTRPAKLFLTVGLPGSGKTTYARGLEQSHAAVRFTPDEWMIPLFGESGADGGRDRMEGLLINVGLRALTIGTNVVLDFGLWGRHERSALRSLGADVGADVEVVYLPIDEATQLQRVHERFLARPAETFEMTHAEIAQWRIQFEEPTADELSGGPVPGPPRRSRDLASLGSRPMAHPWLTTGSPCAAEALNDADRLGDWASSPTGRYSPAVPSSSSLVASACPACRAVSLIK